MGWEKLTGVKAREQGLGVKRGAGHELGRRAGGRGKGGRGGYSTADPEAVTGCKRRSCQDDPAPGLRLQPRPSVGKGRLGRTGRPSTRARNGADVRTCRAMPRHSVVERSRIAFSMKVFFGDCSSRGRKPLLHADVLCWVDHCYGS